MTLRFAGDPWPQKEESSVGSFMATKLIRADRPPIALLVETAFSPL